MTNSRLRSWVRLDDQWLMHQKVRRVDVFARAIWVAALCWSHSHDTDGEVPEHMIAILASMAGISPDEGPRLAEQLTEAGLWDLTLGGWTIHDYDECQETTAEREARRRQDRDRAQRARASKPVTRDSRVSHGDGTRESRLPETETETETETEKKKVLHRFKTTDRQTASSVVENAIALIAAKRHAEARSSGAVRSTSRKGLNAHLAGCVANVDAEDGQALADLAAQHPGLDATALVDRYERLTGDPMPASPTAAARWRLERGIANDAGRS